MTDAIDIDRTSKAERLQLAGQVAPILRRRAGKARYVKTVDASGNVVRHITDVEVAQSLLNRADIELAVRPDKRPEWVKCKTCDYPIPVKVVGLLPSVCPPGTHSCECGKKIRGVVDGKIVCGFGKKCHSCTARHGAVFVTDDDFRAMLASASGWRSAAKKMGLATTSVRNRAQKLGIRPGAKS